MGAVVVVYQLRRTVGRMTTSLLKPTKPIIIGMARPAGMGYTCDCWYKSPDGLRLVRCRRRASHRITIKTPTGCYAIKRCPAHRNELLAQAASGATFEILDEQEIGADF
jgi:hypothetical protein